MTILLTDDHPIVLEGIKTLLAAAMGNVGLLTASQAAEARQMIGKHSPDIVIVDLDLGQDSGLNLIKHVRQHAPATKVIIYTMHEEAWTIRNMAYANADAVVMKQDDTAELVAAVRAVASGKEYYSTSFCRMMAAMKHQPAPLSERERQVLDMIAQGMSTTDIAQALCLTVSTVEFHRRRIMRKLNVANAAEMVRKAAEMGWNTNI